MELKDSDENKIFYNLKKIGLMNPTKSRQNKRCHAFDKEMVLELRKRNKK
jgi:hypothetical protein